MKFQLIVALTHGDGGGVYIDTGLLKPIDGCRIIGNSATGSGGGIFVDASDALTILRSEISGNTCMNIGGGIGGKELARIHIISCRLEGNRVVGSFAQGGGIYGHTSEITIENSILARNEAGSAGGGAIFTSYILKMANCTVADNSATGPGGGISGAGTVTIRNSIFWGNMAGSSGSQIRLFANGTLNVAWSSIQDGQNGIIVPNLTWDEESMQNQDPEFVNTSINDFRTVGGSLMNDAGNNEEIPDDTFDFDNNSSTVKLPYDVADQPRRIVDPQVTAAGYPANDSPYVDLGAHERCQGTMTAPVIAGDNWQPAPRFFGFQLRAPELSTNRAVRIRLVSLLDGHEDFEAMEGSVRWLGPVYDCPNNLSHLPSYKCAKVQCSPHYIEWPTDESIFVYGPEIVPASVYHVEIVDGACQDEEESCAEYSCELVARTSVWGDVQEPVHVSIADGGPNVQDLSALVDTIKGVVSGLPNNRALLAGQDVQPLDKPVNVLDLGQVVEGLLGYTYPYGAPAGCP